VKSFPALLLPALAALALAGCGKDKKASAASTPAARP